MTDAAGLILFRGGGKGESGGVVDCAHSFVLAFADVVVGKEVHLVRKAVKAQEKVRGGGDIGLGGIDFRDEGDADPIRFAKRYLVDSFWKEHSGQIADWYLEQKREGLEQFKGYEDRKTKAGQLLSRIFTSTEGLPGNLDRIAENLLNLYTSLPSIGHEGMMGHLITDEEVASQWEAGNLGSYSWVFGSKYIVIPILEDFIKKADAVLDGSSDHIADLRFGHDSYIGPLTVLLGINGADRDPEDPNEVKNCYQNWETCKACNIQLVFYRSKKASDPILVKCLLNGCEATLPVPTSQYPYYQWTDFRNFYTQRCKDVPAN